jgi:hypothetical protein
MSHTHTMKRAFFNKHAQDHLKPACAVFTFYDERHKIGINCIFLAAHKVALSFFQNPILNRESNPQAILIRT